VKILIPILDTPRVGQVPRRCERMAHGRAVKPDPVAVCVALHAAPPHEEEDVAGFES
jgi:hypothetical protein